MISRHMQTPTNSPRWNYTGNTDPRRLAALTAGLRLSELIARLKTESRFVCSHSEQKDGDPSYSRAVFCVTVTTELFDLFFNAQTGYRGAYFKGPNVGVRVNRTIIDSLLPTLLHWTAEYCPREDSNWITESLSLPSAKIWLAEEPLSICAKCAGEWSSSYISALKIVNGRWEVSAHTHAVWGSAAPEFTKL